MRRFVEGLDRGQSTLFPERLEDWIGEGNGVRVIDVFVEDLDLAELGFSGVESGYHGHVAKADDLELTGGRVVWQAGLPLPG